VRIEKNERKRRVDSTDRPTDSVPYPGGRRGRVGALLLYNKIKSLILFYNLDYCYIGSLNSTVCARARTTEADWADTRREPRIQWVGRFDRSVSKEESTTATTKTTKIERVERRGVGV
jgi:hypothetical protein